MRVLAVEHHDAPSLGVVGDTLDAEGVKTDVIWGEDGDPMPEDSREYDGLVVLGGAMNALDDERCPYFPDLINLIRDFTDQDKPVMGICLGAQLIARAYEGRAHLEGPFEFGFHPIDLTDEGREDPVVGHMPDGISLFEWHTDHYDLPPEAVKLATGKDYHNQAYRIGRATYAMQFHFEVHRPLVDGWINSHATDKMEQQAPGFREWLPAQYDTHMEPSRAFCEELVRRWLALVS